MTPVTSSALKRVGYDATTRELHVEFHSGKVYTYGDVSPEQQEALVKAESIGRHFAEHIRPLGGRLKQAA